MNQTACTVYTLFVVRNITRWDSILKTRKIKIKITKRDLTCFSPFDRRRWAIVTVTTLRSAAAAEISTPTVANVLGATVGGFDYGAAVSRLLNVYSSVCTIKIQYPRVIVIVIITIIILCAYATRL